MADPSSLWLTDAQSLEAWLTALPGAEPVALDTEFERIDTFYPKPGLVQLASPREAWLVEPAVAADCPAFSAWLADSAAPKLLYAMSEDLDLFRHWLGCEVQGALDLQLGAALAGMGYAVGYAPLVERLLDRALDKSQTRSNWLRRPLSPEQEQYALDDVRYLHPIYDIIRRQLQRKDLAYALAEESAQMARDWQEQSDPAHYFSRLRGGWRLGKAQQAVLQRLAIWRETECRKRNLPRPRVISDKALIEVAEACPRNLQHLASLAEVPPVVVRRYGERLLSEIKAAGPAPEGGTIERPLSREQQPVFKSVKAVVRQAAERHEVPPELLAPRKRLEHWVRQGLEEGGLPETMKRGWRGALLAVWQSDLEDLFIHAQT